MYRMNALKSVKNVLSLARRRSSDGEERNLYGTSQEGAISTDPLLVWTKGYRDYLSSGRFVFFPTVSCIST